MFGSGRYSSAHFANMTSVQAKILVVENDIKTGDHYRLGLSEAGFAVDLAKSGIEALKLASLQMFDLLIIDTALKGMTGCELLQALRRQDSLIPVLFLNGRDHHECRVNTLQRGVEDFLKKPFSFSELLCSIRTILRGRTVDASSLPSICIGDLELDLLRRRVHRAGTRIDLTPKEFGLLELLMRRQGEVLPRSLIASQVWDMPFGSDTNVIDVAVRRLRLKIDEGQEKKMIFTVRGMGYMLEAPAP